MCSPLCFSSLSFGSDTHSFYAIIKVEELTVEDQGADDYISVPDEDTLAGQMAAMRGGSVKKIRSEEGDDESSTDEDKESGVSSDSDSD